MRTTTMFVGLFTMAATAAIFVSPGCAVTPVTMDEAVASYASALCERKFKCSPFNAKLNYLDQATCESALRPWYQAMFTLPDTAFAADQVQRCADALTSVSCDEINYPATHPDCKFLGTRPLDAECGSDMQCQSGYCRRAAEVVCGDCRESKALGEDCSMDSEACEQGTTCGEDFKCVTYPKKEGDACLFGVSCGDGSLRCDDGTCVALLGAGAACTGSECDASSGITCDPATMKCAQRTVAAIGEVCDDQLTVCSYDGECDPTTAKCVVRTKGAGEACESDKDCTLLLKCQEQKCAEPTFHACE